MVSQALFTSVRDDWRTPRAVLQGLEAEFGRLYDPCPAGGKEGLTGRWGRRVFCNPPDGRILPEWIAKGAAEVDAGYTSLVVWLLPARTDTRWFHEVVLPRASEIRFLRGRLSFDDAKWGRAPFPSMLAIWIRRSTGQQCPLTIGGRIRRADCEGENEGTF